VRLKNLPFKLESELYRSCYRLSGRKPLSAPYLSGDGFRSLCSHFYEGESRELFDPLAVRPGELVFCEAWLLREFLGGPAREIACPFSAISHNGDPNLDSAILPLLPSRLHRLFSQNALVRDERVVPLPIGLENRRLHYNGVTRDFDALRRRRIEKRPRILSAFTVGTNAAVRSRALEELSAGPFHDRVERMNSRAYRNVAADYMFIASPPGNGVDCHRTWEAMYLRSVPIVLRSSLTERFAELGLPLLLVDSYAEVSRLDEEALRSAYEKLAPAFASETLWFGYWERTIRAQAEGKD